MECRFFAETSSLTWVSLWVSHISAGAEQGATSGWPRRFAWNIALRLTMVIGLGFAMGNVFWYG